MNEEDKVIINSFKFYDRDELGTETKVPREVPVDIDLSVESIQKDTIINLLS